MEEHISEESATETSCKKARMDQKCLIHSPLEHEDATLVSLRDNDSWASLLRAAQIRNYLPLLDLANDVEENEIPEIIYHRKCRSIFTLKKTLDAIIKKMIATITLTVVRYRENRTEMNIVFLECMMPNVYYVQSKTNI